ncbi:MAG: hypothetical protein K8I27_13090 [Planctomycetes bacterium]|nr:hypothetical protein [Planctomycetota bacterium]
MDLSAVPYLIVSRELACERVYLCLCLIDHMVLGIGLSRDEALRHMVTELEAKYADKYDERYGEDDDLELDALSWN